VQRVAASDADGLPALPAINLARGEYYNSVYPFTDLVRSSSVGWNPNTWTDRDGWLKGLPPGKEAFLWVALHLDAVHGMFLPGDYVISSSSDATLSLVTLSRDMVDNVRAGVGRAAFTVKPSSEGNYAKLSVGIKCRNDTAQPIDVNQLSLHHAAHLNQGRAASTFHPAWMASNRGVSLIRTMDWSATNHSPMTSSERLPALSSRSWSKAVPYAVHARAAAALNADLWLSVPHGGQNLRYTCSAATGKFTTFASDGAPLAHDFAEGGPIVFVDYSQGRASLPAPLEYGRTYHAVNCQGPDFQVAERPTRAPLALQADVSARNYSRVSSALGAEGLSRLYEAIARQVASELPAGRRVYVEYSNEVWNQAFTQANFARQYLAGLGTSPDVPASGYAVGSLLAWRAFEQVLGRERVQRVFCAQAAWFENLAPALDYVDGGWLAKGETIARLADVYAIAPYVMPRDERGRAYSVNSILAAGAASWGGAQWDAAFDRHIAALAGSVASHLDKVRARRRGLLFTSYECGQHFAESVPKEADPAQVQALHRSYLQYLDGAAGAAMYKRYYQRVFVDNGLRHFTHFTDAGGYSSQWRLQQWGLKPSHLSVDNARGAFFKTLPTTV
jgi:putative lipoic acid-binding regulatory protein